MSVLEAARKAMSDKSLLSPASGTCDRAEVYRSAQALFGDGPWKAFCVEMRVPGTWNGTVSGYFSHPKKLADAAYVAAERHLKGSDYAEGVYVTLNPLNPELLARASNKLRGRMKHTASDADVVRRRWLLFDFDPLRPAGISSTDAEATAAMSRALDAAAWLADLGWPEPVVAFSGNGAHLLYRIDLPNTPEAAQLVRSVLEAVDARFSDESVKLDTGVHNAARLVRLYGTKCAKGDSTEDRPHRMARIVAVPEPLELVPASALEALAAPFAKENAPSRAPAPSGNLAEWLEGKGLKVQRSKEWNGAVLHVLKVCPWNPSHTNQSAFVIEFPGGRVVAGCHHNSCRGKGWRDLLEVLGERPPALSAPGVSNGNRSPSRLSSRVAVPEGWDGRLVVVTTDWKTAREAFASGAAVVVAREDGTAPLEAASVLRRAERLELRKASDRTKVAVWVLTYLADGDAR